MRQAVPHLIDRVLSAARRALPAFAVAVIGLSGAYAAQAG